MEGFASKSYLKREVWVRFGYFLGGGGSGCTPCTRAQKSHIDTQCQLTCARADVTL